MQISLLKVFSHEIHQMFENDLEALGSLKQLKYFYNLPIGQVFEALSQLYKPNPNSNYWKATQTRIYDNDLSSKRVCDFLKVRILNCKGWVATIFWVACTYLARPDLAALIEKLPNCLVCTLCCKCLGSFAFLWCKMPMFRRAGMREGGKPLQLAFRYLIFMV